MRPSDVELWALDVLERAKTKGTPPAQRVTLWPAWPDPAKAARRLAAGANAARGLPLLWIIGTGASKKGKGATLDPFQAWERKVSDAFDGLAPGLRAFRIPLQEHEMVVVAVETERAPFVVKAASGRLEVPWLEKTTVRSARRSELLRLLAPLSRMPFFEMLEADLCFFKNMDQKSQRNVRYRWSLDATVYVVPAEQSRVVLPLHRTRVVTQLGEEKMSGSQLSLTPDVKSSGIRGTDSALLIESLGSFFVYACGTCRTEEIVPEASLLLNLEFVPSGFDQSALVNAELRSAPLLDAHQFKRWRL